MTGKDLVIAMSGIDGRYIEEAAPAAAPKTRSLRRPLLVAAAIAAALLLVGCGIVYALRLQDMSIGKATYTQRFDDKGKAIDPVEKSVDIITPYGRSGDAIQQALKEWYEFQESYDPDGALMTNDPDNPDIPNQYEYTYGCYTQEMVDKVDEIVAKYNLKLLDVPIVFQRYQSDIFLEETGIQSLLLPDSNAQMLELVGELFLPYNIYMEFQIATENADSPWGHYCYTRKDYFPEGVAKLPGCQRGHDEGRTGIHRRSVRLLHPAEGSQQSRRRGKAGRGRGGLSGRTQHCDLHEFFRFSQEFCLHSR